VIRARRRYRSGALWQYRKRSQPLPTTAGLPPWPQTFTVYPPAITKSNPYSAERRSRRLFILLFTNRREYLLDQPPDMSSRARAYEHDLKRRRWSPGALSGPSGSCKESNVLPGSFIGSENSMARSWREIRLPVETNPAAERARSALFHRGYVERRSLTDADTRRNAQTKSRPNHI
jgi:hypothetical protein